MTLAVLPSYDIYWKELDIEMLIEVSPDLDKEGASIQFLSEKVLGPLCGLISLEEYQCP